MPVRLLTNFNGSILQGEDRQKSKASAPGMARVEPPGMGLRRLYDLPVFTDTDTLSLTARAIRCPFFYFYIPLFRGGEGLQIMRQLAIMAVPNLVLFRLLPNLLVQA
ncbi:Yersinia protein of uncharacterised function (DUF3831) [Yersinia enterocolitica]|nr:hypothetical protein CH48_40 [Yersinia enterocolitica]CNG48746.1 Yersinia protein of uncharacterised function (DUF3831) [Yersinia enterocolitica]CNH29307.1 Yersinia protein of uncharacterised function (DUF3831) [Yersinia enterocolitica]CRY00790.1 Yersinia protein of uncharacterised function (DUF3831) [Yersinia enterocolitica]